MTLPNAAPLALSALTTLGFVLACGGGGTPAPAPEPVAPTPAPAAAPAPEAAPAVVPPGPALERIRKRGALVVAMDMGEGGAGTPPMYVPGADGKPDGFDYVVAKWVASAVGVPEVRLVHGAYSELPEMLRASKEIDVVISGYSPSDLPGIVWSYAYLEYGLALVVPKDSTVLTVDDLRGRDVGMFNDPAARAEVDKLVKGYTSLVQMEDGYWDALSAGKFAGFLYDYPYAAAEIEAWYAANPAKRGSLKFAQYNLNTMEYAVALREGEPDLAAAVDDGITRFYASDDYGATVRRFLSGGTTVAPATVPATAKTYVVKSGDTLSLIAMRELGDKGKWKAIWELNRSRLASPHLIEPGDTLVLP